VSALLLVTGLLYFATLIGYKIGKGER